MSVCRLKCRQTLIKIFFPIGSPVPVQKPENLQNLWLGGYAHPKHVRLDSSLDLEQTKQITLFRPLPKKH